MKVTSDWNNTNLWRLSCLKEYYLYKFTSVGDAFWQILADLPKPLDGIGFA
jgi:hypothetical protein